MTATEQPPKRQGRPVVHTTRESLLRAKEEGKLRYYCKMFGIELPAQLTRVYTPKPKQKPAPEEEPPKEEK